MQSSFHTQEQILISQCTKEALAKSLSVIFNMVNIQNPFQYIKQYPTIGAADVEYNIMEARAITLNKSEFLAYSSMHFMGHRYGHMKLTKILDPSPNRSGAVMQ